MLGMADMLSLLSVCGEIYMRPQKGVWNADTHVETRYDVTSILKVGKSSDIKWMSPFLASLVNECCTL